MERCSSSDAGIIEGATCNEFSCRDEVAARIALLYGDERLSDVTFVVQGATGPEQRFVAHRNIVSAWSAPLDRMLCGDFAEGSLREVHIHDVEPAAFEAMLQLMYRGTAEITGDNVLAILDVSVRFDVAPLVQFSIQFLLGHTSSEHACRMLGVGVQYSLVKLIDKCIELIVTDEHILESEDFCRLSQAAVVELARHDSWNLHEDEIYDTMLRWGSANSSSEDERKHLLGPVLDHVRYPYMSVEKLKLLTTTSEVPHTLIFDALFFKLHHVDGSSQLTGRYRPRTGSLLFSWVHTQKVTVSGDYRENARHTSANGFTGVRGDRRMQCGVYSWIIDIAETQSSWIFVGIAHADDTNDVAWRSSGHMLYCLDSRYFHQGSGQNHPTGDRKIQSGDCIRVVLDCTQRTLAFGVNKEKPLVLFRDLPPAPYVPAVDLRDCGDKVRILSSNPHVNAGSADAQTGWTAPSAAVRSDVLAEPADVVAAYTPVGLQHNAHPHVEAQRRGSAPATPSAAGYPGAQAAPGDVLHGVQDVANGSEPADRLPPPRDGPPAAVSGVAPRRATVGNVEVQQHTSHGAVPSSGGHSHGMYAFSGSSARTLQPRQSQGPQGGAPTAAVAISAQERGAMSGIDVSSLSTAAVAASAAAGPTSSAIGGPGSAAAATAAGPALSTAPALAAPGSAAAATAAGPALSIAPALAAPGSSSAPGVSMSPLLEVPTPLATQVQSLHQPAPAAVGIVAQAISAAADAMPEEVRHRDRPPVQPQQQHHHHHQQLQQPQQPHQSHQLHQPAPQPQQSPLP